MTSESTRPDAKQPPPGSSAPIPIDAIETISFDVGNTLISMDFDLVSEHLASLGAQVAADALQRAEAAARPLVSAAVRRFGKTESEDVFVLALRTALAHLPPESGTHDRLDRLAHDLAGSLRTVPTARLWSRLLPGVRVALQALAQRALTLVAVSNSDGTAATSLRNARLIEMFAVVIDSHVVGTEKPDPRIFAQALARSGGQPHSTLHVGDLYDVDIVGARRAGLHALLVDPFGDWPAGLDCARIAGVHALPAWMQSGAP